MVHISSKNSIVIYLHCILLRCLFIIHFCIYIFFLFLSMLHLSNIDCVCFQKIVDIFVRRLFSLYLFPIRLFHLLWLSRSMMYIWWWSWSCTHQYFLSLILPKLVYAVGWEQNIIQKECFMNDIWYFTVKENVYKMYRESTMKESLVLIEYNVCLPLSGGQELCGPCLLSTSQSCGR